MKVAEAPASAQTLGTGRIAPFALAGLVAIFILTMVLLGRAGEFPLNDDWSFVITTRRFAETGSWHPLGFASMPLITNSLFAMPFCKLSACGFGDLRLATGTAMLVLIVAAYGLARLGRADTTLALACAALTAFNPIAYALSFTFMTDVVFSALFAVAGIMFVLAIRRNSLAWAGAATLVSVAATLSRQLGLALPLAFLVVQCVAKGRWSRRLTLGLVPLAICTLALVAFNGWLKASGRLPAIYYTQVESLTATLTSPKQLALRTLNNFISTLLYVGFFVSPVVFLTGRMPDLSGRAWLRRLPRIVAGGAVVVAVLGMVGAKRWMPFGKGVLVPEGIGPLTLRDTYILDLPNVPHLSPLWWGLVTALGLVGGFGLVDRVVRVGINTVVSWQRGELDGADLSRLFAIVAVVAYFVPLFPTSIYDRYFVPVLPLVFFVLASGPAAARGLGRVPAGAAAATCVLIGLFSILATHDYLSWNRTRWTAIADLEASRQADASTLDGGFEYNGYRNYDPAYRPDPNKSVWWVKNDDYMITFGPIAGMQVLKSYPYTTFLPPARRSLDVLSRSSASASPAP